MITGFFGATVRATIQFRRRRRRRRKRMGRRRRTKRRRGRDSESIHDWGHRMPQELDDDDDNDDDDKY
jgi:hypothetical protein